MKIYFHTISRYFHHHRVHYILWFFEFKARGVLWMINSSKQFPFIHEANHVLHYHPVVFLLLFCVCKKWIGVICLINSAWIFNKRECLLIQAHKNEKTFIQQFFRMHKGFRQAISTAPDTIIYLCCVIKYLVAQRCCLRILTFFELNSHSSGFFYGTLLIILGTVSQIIFCQHVHWAIYTGQAPHRSRERFFSGALRDLHVPQFILSPEKIFYCTGLFSTRFLFYIHNIFLLLQRVKKLA